MSTPDPQKTSPTSGDKPASKKRQRSPSYPFINLERAIKLANTLWEKERRHPATIPVVCGHWELSAKSSAGILSVAALKKFGLLIEEGSGEQRTVRLSDFALDVIKFADVPEDFSKLIKYAALKPDLHLDLWNFHREASDASIRRYLVFDRKFNEAVVDAVIKEYRDTLAFAKITPSDTFDDTATGSDPEPAAIPMTSAQSPPSVQHRQQPPQLAPVRPAASSMNAALRYLPIPLDIGDAPIPVGMSEDDFQLLLDTLALWKKKIVRTPEAPEEYLRRTGLLDEKDSPA